MIIKIFIVEDEVILLNSLSKKITDLSSDYKVIGTAYNATDALNKIPKLMPDVVLTDIRMPGKTGLELISQLKPLLPSLLFVIISGYSDFDYAQKAISLAVEHYLLKPVNIDDLNTCLTSCKNKMNELKKSQHHTHPMMISNNGTNWSDTL